MIGPEDSLRSRRTFIKSALTGTAGMLMADIDKHAAHAYAGAQEKQQGSNVSQLSLSEASQLVRRKKVSSVELTHECLSRIERLNPKLNAFITVTADSALAEARAAEEEIHRRRWKGPLHGIPIALKDLIDTAGVRTTAAIGSDTGGSIRQPASYCGIVELKPTYGRVSTSGVIPLSWSLDHVGPMTRTAMDAALMLKVIAGYDPQDPGSIDLPVPDYV